MDDQLLSEFLAEAEDLIAALYADLSALRGRGADGRARRELVGQVFRRVHTLKGSAAAAGVESVGALAHEFESLLEAVRMGRVALAEDVLAAAEEAVDALSAGLSAAACGGRADAPRELSERLRRLSEAGGTAAGQEEDEEQLLPREVARLLGAYELQRAREAAREGARLFVVAVSFGLEDFDEQFRRLSEALGARGEVVSTLPVVSGEEPERVGFRVVYATGEGREQVDAVIEPFGATLFEDGKGQSDEVEDEGSGAGESATRADGAAGGAPPQSAAPLTMQVRVPLEVLDDLISSAHELFNESTAALALASERGTDAESAERVRRRFVEFEERLIALRMVPLGATLERAARAGQAAARAAGRAVDFEIEGGDVRLDKSLAEGLADPLLHLLRNAVDHGVEPSEERRAAGKPERGRVRLEAFAEGSRVAVRVSDDGRGVDAERVARAARERGLVPASARVTERQALRLIFRPGFSTAESATQVSGRGVGLEVVERAVEQAGGELRVWSGRGRGTTFEMRLPTTLALASVVVVRAGGRRYCLDARHVVETLHAAPGDLSGDADARALDWRGASLAVLELRGLLGENARPDVVDESGDGGRVPLVVARTRARRGGGSGPLEEERFALAVEGIEGGGEVLVRGLGRHATRWRGVSGATELRDGTVALVLDLPRLLDA